MTSKEHIEELNRLVSKFESALSEAEAYAVEHNLSFSISPTYGMGGTFGKVTSSWQASETGAEIGEFTWISSSVGC